MKFKNGNGFTDEAVAFKVESVIILPAALSDDFFISSFYFKNVI